MATYDQTDDELNTPTNTAPLGAEQGPVSRPEDDPRDMSTVMANANVSRTPGPDAAFGDSRPTGQGTEFDQQRRQGAAGTGDNSGAVGRGQGQGFAAFNGDVDRGYDQSGHRGGLGTSGGRDDFPDRNFDKDSNPMTGGYGGGDYNRPDESITQHIGMNSRNPTDESDASQQDQNSTEGGAATA